ncbi:hypothetical protein VP01_640g2 [Puccinia sorghi]|uniref:SNF2 N-terminal domain-containing protein n=1 Tax=Puccinia sorghi TaxID=27349 RepID=A0A0L6UFV1_9BASI|nr:hypothetical protein VP01_640g2 [Puccinia sorghi]
MVPGRRNCTPRNCSASSISCTIGNKAAKKCQIEIYQACMSKLSKATIRKNAGGFPIHCMSILGNSDQCQKKPIHGCKTTLLAHQQEALDFILELESPKSSTLSRFWNLSASKWLKHFFDHFQNAKAKLVICPLSMFSNWEDEIHKHLELNLSQYAVYHGEEQQNWLTQMLWANKIVLQNGFTPYWMKPSNLICDSATKQSQVILALETQLECHWWPVENKGD